MPAVRQDGGATTQHDYHEKQLGGPRRPKLSHSEGGAEAMTLFEFEPGFSIALETVTSYRDQEARRITFEGGDDEPIQIDRQITITFEGHEPITLVGDKKADDFLRAIAPFKVANSQDGPQS